MPIYKDEKGVPFINFIIVNAKNLTDGILKKNTEIWHILIHWDLNH